MDKRLLFPEQRIKIYSFLAGRMTEILMLFGQDKAAHKIKQIDFINFFLFLLDQYYPETMIVFRLKDSIRIILKLYLHNIFVIY